MINIVVNKEFEEVLKSAVKLIPRVEATLLTLNEQEHHALLVATIAVTAAMHDKKIIEVIELTLDIAENMENIYNEEKSLLS